MKRIAPSLVALCLICAGYTADWGVYRVYAPDPRSIQRVSDSDLTLMSEDVGYTTDVAAPSEGALKKLGLRYEKIGTVSDPAKPYERLTDGTDYRTEYLRYDEIIAQCEEWRLQYPTLITKQQIGVSIQNRPMWVYRLHNPDSIFPPVGVFIQGGIHAREWISPPVCMYTLDSLLHEALQSTAGWELISRYEINVIPVVNPDGYEYTWGPNRLWRKNRRDIVGSSQFGVDLNRNYSKGWGGEGSSGNFGSETYRGTAPFSEPEVANIRDYLNSRTPKISFVFGIDYHSYAQKILYPWSYSFDPTPHAAEFEAIGNTYRNAILASGGLEYEVGQGSINLYIASGASKDFYYDEYGTFAYTVEVRPTGSPGFELPPSQILPTVRENYAGFKAVLRSLL